MTKPQDLLALAQAAIHYAQAVADTQHCKEVLRGGYIAWRFVTGNQHTDLTRGDANWQAMMAATAGEYQHLRNAKGRERRSQQKAAGAGKAVGGRAMTQKKTPDPTKAESSAPNTAQSTATDKDFHALRSAYAQQGHHLHSVTTKDGATTYWAERWGLVRYLASLHDAALFLAQIGGRL